MKWGVKSMVWYVFVIMIALLISLFYYNQFIKDPGIQKIFFWG